MNSVLNTLKDANLSPRLMIDASHGNSSKDFRRQPIVASDVAKQIANGQTGISGIMLESFLVDGQQELDWSHDMVYGQSVTDACMGWEMLVPVLDELAAAVKKTTRNNP